MKLNINDISKIISSLQDEGVTEVDVTERGMFSKLVADGVETFISVLFIIKDDGTPGLKVLKNVTTKEVILDEGKSSALVEVK